MHLLYHGKQENEKNIWNGAVVGIMVFFLFFAFPYGTADAAVSMQTLHAVKLIQSNAEIWLAPLQKKTITIGFKNTGKNPWPSGATSRMDVRASVRGESYFHAPSWQSGFIVKKIISKTQVGEVAYVTFDIEAPRTAGTYRETFALYVSGKKISGADAAFTLRVFREEKKNIVSPELPKSRHQEKNQFIQSEQKKEPQTAPQSFRAMKLIQSAFFFSLQQYKTTPFIVGYKNNGAASWVADGTPRMTLRSLVKKESYFYHASWISGNVVGALQQDAQPGEIAYMAVVLEAPYITGNYQERFAFFAGEEKIPDTEFGLPVTVTKAPALLVSAPPPQSAPQQQALFKSQPQYIIQSPPLPARVGVIDDIQEQEPNIRIGVTHTRDPISITANAPYEIRDGTSALLSTEDASAVSTVTFDFSTRAYSAVTPKGTFTSQSLFRFQGVGNAGSRGILTAAAINGEDTQSVSSSPENIQQNTASTSSDSNISPPNTSTSTSQQAAPNSDIVFEIISFLNRPSWSATLNDNKYRNMLEVRYASATDRIWIINELPLEQYLKGISETSNNSPYEYQKTMTIAARTYAKYHIERSTKYYGEYFTIRNTDADQVYRGYNAELRLANQSRAVAETRGVMVFYDNKLVITPYYSQSDGRTRSWEEVWAGGPKPWLVSKDDPVGRGLPLLGHGVGIAARGAVAMALEGKTYEEILKYYYTGVELHRRY